MKNSDKNFSRKKSKEILVKLNGWFHITKNIVFTRKIYSYHHNYVCYGRNYVC